MADILEKAKQHFLEKISDEMKTVSVPEWGATIYYKPLSLKQQDRIYKYIRDGSLEAMAETLIVRALDGDGNPLFKSVNKTELMNMVDPKVINRIVVSMADDEEDFEELEGN